MRGLREGYRHHGRASKAPEWASDVVDNLTDVSAPIEEQARVLEATEHFFMATIIARVRALTRHMPSDLFVQNAKHSWDITATKCVISSLNQVTVRMVHDDSRRCSSDGDGFDVFWESKGTKEQPHRLAIAKKRVRRLRNNCREIA